MDGAPGLLEQQFRIPSGAGPWFPSQSGVSRGENRSVRSWTSGFLLMKITCNC